MHISKISTNNKIYLKKDNKILNNNSISNQKEAKSNASNFDYSNLINFYGQKIKHRKIEKDILSQAQDAKDFFKFTKSELKSVQKRAKSRYIDKNDGYDLSKVIASYDDVAYLKLLPSDNAITYLEPKENGSFDTYTFSNDKLIAYVQGLKNQNGDISYNKKIRIYSDQYFEYSKNVCHSILKSKKTYGKVAIFSDITKINSYIENLIRPLSYDKTATWDKCISFNIDENSKNILESYSKKIIDKNGEDVLEKANFYNGKMINYKMC